MLRVRIGDYTDGHGSGKSASSPETRQVIKKPSVVRELKAASGNGQVRLSWKAPASTGGSAILRYERRHRLGHVELLVELDRVEHGDERHGAESDQRPGVSVRGAGGQRGRGRACGQCRGDASPAQPGAGDHLGSDPGVLR